MLPKARAYAKDGTGPDIEGPWRQPLSQLPSAKGSGCQNKPQRTSQMVRQLPLDRAPSTSTRQAEIWPAWRYHVGQ